MGTISKLWAIESIPLLPLRSLWRSPRRRPPPPVRFHGSPWEVAYQSHPKPHRHRHGFSSPNGSLPRARNWARRPALKAGRREAEATAQTGFLEVRLLGCSTWGWPIRFPQSLHGKPLHRLAEGLSWGLPLDSLFLFFYSNHLIFPKKEWQVQNLGHVNIASPGASEQKDLRKHPVARTT